MKKIGKRVDQIPPKYRKGVVAQLNKVSDVLKRARIENDLTQESLAELVDVEVSTVKSIEQKKRVPSMGLFFYLCEVLKISVKLD
jgi:DNA-binding XRE family transcriptional regulator